MQEDRARFDHVLCVLNRPVLYALDPTALYALDPPALRMLVFSPFLSLRCLPHRLNDNVS